MMRYTLITCFVLLMSCGGGKGPGTGLEPVDDFDRKQMLSDWADGIIIPAYEAYVLSLDSMKQSAEAFAQQTSPSKLAVLRESWREAYAKWQYVAMFEIGKAEELSLRSYTNVYPCDTNALIDNISSGNYKLELPSTIDMQGFPALDFMLNGLAPTDIEITDIYTADASYAFYLRQLCERLYSLTKEVLNDWKANYRSAFIENFASSATGSVDKLVNDFVYYYERHLRAGKVGIPAGVFSGKIEAQTVEALYAADMSRTLLLHALDACQKFFNGLPAYDGFEGQSLAQYLDYLNTIKTGADLSKLINEQFQSAREEINDLDEDFRQQIQSDNIQLLEAYDALQMNVIFLKVDMMQALNIRVDYVDADGD